MSTAVIGLTIAFATGAAGIFYLLIRAARRSQTRGARVFAAVLIPIVFIALPGLFDTAVMATNRTIGLTRLMVDPGWFIKAAPGIVGMLVAVLLNRKSLRWLWHGAP